MQKLLIKELCKQKGISLSELAKKIGVTHPTISNVVGMHNSPRLDTLEKIAEALNVELWELFTEKRNNEPFVAVIKEGGKFYTASNLAELKKIVAMLDDNQ